jgi:hypothetical protein
MEDDCFREICLLPPYLWSKNTEHKHNKKQVSIHEIIIMEFSITTAVRAPNSVT